MHRKLDRSFLLNYTERDSPRAQLQGAVLGVVTDWTEKRFGAQYVICRAAQQVDNVMLSENFARRCCWANLQVEETAGRPAITWLCSGRLAITWLSVFWQTGYHVDVCVPTDRLPRDCVPADRLSRDYVLAHQLPRDCDPVSMGTSNPH